MGPTTLDLDVDLGFHLDTHIYLPKYGGWWSVPFYTWKMKCQVAWSVQGYGSRSALELKGMQWTIELE